jgi:hypothetical protein
MDLNRKGNLPPVKFANWDDDSSLTAPVEPELLRRLEQQDRDLSMTSPTPSVLQGLSDQSVALYDCGVRSGIAWAHDWLEHDHRDTERDPQAPDNYRSMAYNTFAKMAVLSHRKRPHLYRAYAEGWLNGWQAATNLEV